MGTTCRRCGPGRARTAGRRRRLERRRRKGLWLQRLPAVCRPVRSAGGGGERSRGEGGSSGRGSAGGARSAGGSVGGWRPVARSSLFVLMALVYAVIRRECKPGGRVSGVTWATAWARRGRGRGRGGEGRGGGWGGLPTFEQGTRRSEQERGCCLPTGEGRRARAGGRGPGPTTASSADAYIPARTAACVRARWHGSGRPVKGRSTRRLARHGCGLGQSAGSARAGRWGRAGRAGRGGAGRAGQGGSPSF